MSKFNEWVQSWWQRFDKMEIGQAYEVARCAKDAELFLDLCKQYIDRSEKGSSYCFSEDYRFFKRFTWHESELISAGNYNYIKKALPK